MVRHHISKRYPNVPNPNIKYKTGLKLLFKKQNLKSKLAPINGIISDEKMSSARFIYSKKV